MFLTKSEVRMNVYIDNNATTQPLQSVVNAMIPFLEGTYANPSSLHLPGRTVRARVEQAREDVAAMIRCNSPSDIIFTSGGTESICHAFFIGLENQRQKDPHIVVSAVEHAAVLEVTSFYRSKGAHIDEVAVGRDGKLDFSNLEEVLAHSPRQTFVSIMLANNETGVLFPLPEVAELCKRYNAYLHVDAVQAVGKFPIDVSSLGCDYLSLSAHKFHGPKGIGALYIRNGAPRLSILKGHQENGARGGTENVPGIIGMGAASQAVMTSLEADIHRMRELRDKLEVAILRAVPVAEINGDRNNRLCNTSNIFFPGKNSASMVEQLSARGVYVSSGAACTTGKEPSHVLRAMGLSDKRANASLRFSVSKLSSDDDVTAAVDAVNQVFTSSLDVHEVN